MITSENQSHQIATKKLFSQFQNKSHLLNLLSAWIILVTMIISYIRQRNYTSFKSMKTMEDLSSLKYAILAYLFCITIIVPSTQYPIFMVHAFLCLCTHKSKKFLYHN